MKIFLPGAGNKSRHIANFRELPGVSRVIISDIYPWAYGQRVADAAYLMPRFDHPGFWDAFDQVFRLDPFDVCIPMHDASLVLFSAHRAVARQYGFKLVINPKSTIDLAADKLATFEFFTRRNLKTPRTWILADFCTLAKAPFPCFLKPRYIEMRGSDRQVFRKLNDAAELEQAVAGIAPEQQQDYVVQEYLNGVEINIDFFCDADGRLVIAEPLKRLAMGTSRGIARGEIITDERLRRQARQAVEQVAEGLHLTGANQLQAYLEADGELACTEINARLSGSSVLVKEAGVNLFACLLQMINGEPIRPGGPCRPLYMSTFEQPTFFTEMPPRTIHDLTC